MNYFEKNLTLLHKKNPQLAEHIQQAPEDAIVRLQPTPSGTPTLHLQTQDCIHALHHPQDPIGDAQQFVRSLPDLNAKRNIALLGCGLGYIPRMILNSHPGLQNLFIFESSFSVVRQALQAIDFSEILGHPHVHLIVGANQQEIYSTLMMRLMEIMANPILLVEIPSFRAAFPQWAETITKQIQEIYYMGQSGLMTKFKDGPRCLRNLFHNYETITNTPGISIIDNCLQGIPAIIVAAGPSLAKNIEQLKNGEDRFVIFATDTTLEVLLAHGITPHFVITVDPTELNLRHFNQERYPEECTLIFDPESRPEIPKKFSRRLTYMTDKHPFFEWLNRETGGKGIIPKGGMVSQAAFYLAREWGCSPIILIGQDLALDPQSGGTHIKNTANYRQVNYLHDDPNHIAVPAFTADQSDSKEPLYWVDGVEGKKVPTIQSFLNYIRMLEEDIRKTSQAVIDATEGGAKIEGTIIAPLKEILERYKQQTVLVSQQITAVLQERNISALASKATQKKLQNYIHSKAQLAEKGLAMLSDSSQTPLPQLEQNTETYRKRIFSDPVSEYLIEYAAPRELFEFLKLGPANATESQQRETIKHRMTALLNATIKAKEVLEEIFK